MTGVWVDGPSSMRSRVDHVNPSMPGQVGRDEDEGGLVRSHQAERLERLRPWA